MLIVFKLTEHSCSKHESLDLHLKRLIKKKNLFWKSLVFWKKESEMKWNSEHLFKLATLEINAIWRRQYFFWYCLINFNIVASFFIWTGEKNLEHIHHSPPYVSSITENILITVIIFCLLLTALSWLILSI